MSLQPLLTVSGRPVHKPKIFLGKISHQLFSGFEGLLLIHHDISAYPNVACVL